VVEMLGDSTDSMLTVLDDVLSFQKIEDGKFTLDMGEFSLEEICGKAVRTFQKHFQSKNMQVVVQIDENIPKILWGDGARIRQVFQNLLSNAIKFSPEGSQISISMKKAGNQSPTVYSNSSRICPVSISVRDRGMGISLEEQAQLFVPFTQIRPGEVQDGRGSGLGLSICRQIVELHRGEINVSSAPGQGSCFTFRIPFAVPLKRKIDGAEFDTNSSRSSSLGNRRKSIKSLLSDDDDMTPCIIKRPKVLVVDDVKSNRRLLEVALAKMGCDVDCAENGLEAMNQVSYCHSEVTQQNYDVVLLDNVMPKMTGVECARELRRKGIQVPIVGVTGNAVQEDVEEFLAAGATHVLTKPVQLTDLRNTLRDLVTKSVMS
jgi:CheY-like chemotaxis protein